MAQSFGTPLYYLFLHIHLLSVVGAKKCSRYLKSVIGI